MRTFVTNVLDRDKASAEQSSNERREPLDVLSDVSLNDATNRAMLKYSVHVAAEYGTNNFEGHDALEKEWPNLRERGSSAPENVWFYLSR